MPAKNHVRAVGADERATTPRRPPVTIKEAAGMTERDLLVAMRTKVAAEIDAGVPAHALAPLMRQLRDFDKEIRALDARDQEEAPSSGPTADESWQAI